MPIKYHTVVLYAGEVKKFPMKHDCWQFASLTAAAEWLVNNSSAANLNAARVGLSSILIGRRDHYLGYTISVAQDKIIRT